MNSNRERRNGGRVLAVVIESGDVPSRKALQALSHLTRDTFKARGFEVCGWPTDVRRLLAGEGAASRVARIDAHGEQHVFALADCGDFDVLVGVSSRREMNVPGEVSGNLATNVLLTYMGMPDPLDPSRPRYGQVGAEDLGRLWRNEVGAAHVQSFAKSWDLVLWSRVDYLDYLVPGTTLMGTLRGNQSAEQANSVVENGAKHKATAHREGVLKYAPGQTHPLVRVNPATRRILGYHESAVAAFRDAVRLLRNGASWDEVAAAVGGRIPAPQAQQEPDIDVDGSRVRTRQSRNELRVARGLDALPMRFLEDGSPNPDYKGETVLDLSRPGERLHELLVCGLSMPRRHAHSISQRVDSDLDGIHPDDVFLEFYATGVYRRLVKNQALSNSSMSRFTWQCLDLGPTADGEPVLSRADVEFLRSLRTGRTGTGSWGNNPLTGVFRIDQDSPLYTRSGYLDPATGSFKVRSGSTGDQRGLRVWFEPLGATPHSKECNAIAWLPNSTIGPAVSRMIVEALQSEHDLATFQFHHQVLRKDPLVAAKQVIAGLERRHDVTAVRLADPDLSELTLAALKRELLSIESQLDEAHVALRQAEMTIEGPSTHSDHFDITDLAQLAAVVGAGTPVPTSTAERAARLLRTFLQNARLILEPATASVRIEASLVLNNAQGLLTIPVSARVANCSSDPWVAGAAGMWWERRRTTFSEVMRERALLTTPSSGTRWRAPIAERLFAEAAARGRPLRGMNLASLIVRCDNAALVEAVRDAIDGAETSDVLRRFLFEGPDVPKGLPWDKAAEHLL